MWCELEADDLATIRERPSRRDKGVIRYEAQIRMDGFPPRTKTFPSRREAERWAKTVEASMIEGRHYRSSEARNRTLREAIDRYFTDELGLPEGADRRAILQHIKAEEAAGRELKKRDIPTRVGRLLWWRERLGSVKLAELTPALLAEYRGKLKKEPFTRAKPGAKRSTLKKGEKAAQFKRSDSTVRAFLEYLSAVCKLARKDWQWMSHNPFDGVTKPAASKKCVRFLSEEERERLMAETAKDPQLHTLVILALATAPRAGELLDLRWRDIEIEKTPGADGEPVETARVLLRRTKNSEPRAVWLHGEALKLLKAHRAHRPTDDDRVFASIRGKRYDYSEPFDEACAAAKVLDFRFHDLRHSSATYLAREGATEQQLKAIGGWKSNVVSRYVHLAAQDAKAVLEKMNKKILGGA